MRGTIHHGSARKSLGNGRSTYRVSCLRNLSNTSESTESRVANIEYLVPREDSGNFKPFFNSYFYVLEGI